ncbi:general substrate transporter, partial [Mycena floridula]
SSENEKKSFGEDEHIPADNRIAVADVLQTEKPALLSKSMIRLYCICAISYLISTLNGYDSSLMGAINAMKPYQETFHMTGDGSSTGIVFIIYNLGQIAAFPFCGLLADGLGRRHCIFIGCIFVLTGTAIQATANMMSQFMGGRFLLGFGAALACAAGPAYMVELAHPAYRGTMAGSTKMFFRYLGNILAGWTTYGSNKNFPSSSLAWRIPTAVQCAMPTLVAIFILFFPESPRHLISKGKKEEALAVLAKYHGAGNPQHPVVVLQYREIVDEMEANHTNTAWWDFSELYNTRAARYRLLMVTGIGIFGQWSGNNVISYFMPEMFAQAGITNTNTQLLLNAINPIFSMAGAVYGACLLDKMGRRFMLLGAIIAALVTYIMLTAFTAQAIQHPGSNLSIGVIVSIYLFGIGFSWGMTPLQALYPVECLTNRTRAKGNGANFLILNIALVLNTYGISVGIQKIGWHIYLVYIGWLVVELFCVYFFFVETKGRTLEELTEVFESPNPVKASLQKTNATV